MILTLKQYKNLLLRKVLYHKRRRLPVEPTRNRLDEVEVMLAINLLPQTIFNRSTALSISRDTKDSLSLILYGFTGERPYNLIQTKKGNYENFNNIYRNGS